jgi:hypothetical protein
MVLPAPSRILKTGEDRPVQLLLLRADPEDQAIKRKIYYP